MIHISTLCNDMNRISAEFISENTCLFVLHSNIQDMRESTRARQGVVRNVLPFQCEQFMI